MSRPSVNQTDQKIRLGILGSIIGFILYILFLFSSTGKEYIKMSSKLNEIGAILYIFPLIFYILLGFLIGMVTSKINK